MRVKTLISKNIEIIVGLLHNGLAVSALFVLSLLVSTIVVLVLVATTMCVGSVLGDPNAFILEPRAISVCNSSIVFFTILLTGVLSAMYFIDVEENK